VSNIIQNSLGGFVTGAVTTVGGYAGSAVTGVGNLIESSGRAVGDVGIAGRFNSWGEGINSYGQSIKNATAPNAGGAAPVKKTDQKALPSSGTKKALPASKQMKALPAPPAKKDTVSKPPAKKDNASTSAAKEKTTYTPPGGSTKSTASTNSGVGANGVRKSQRQANGNKKVTPESRSLPGYKSATNANGLKAKTLQTPASAKSATGAKEPKPAIPGFGFGEAGSKAGSVAGGYKPSYTAPSGGNKTSAKQSGPKPAIAGYGFGDKAASKAGSVAGGPSFF